ncbi:MAG: N-acetylmuramoyl-L-alanine amidase [Rhizobiales bacterium]|nr:N-acetylmuramoyl-L-alanine amidase [Hyphomicrobiales bacterium]
MIRTSLPHVFRPSPNIEPRKGGVKPDILLVHYTEMESAQAACDWLCDPASKVSCHYLVDEDGSIVQMVDEAMRAWHAGASSWQGESDINSRSIGIEIQNPGPRFGYRAFPDVQMRAVIALSKDIIARNSIRPERVLAHSDVAPGRKIDPGALFDWHLLHEEGIGHWVAPAPIDDGAGLMAGDSGSEVERLQSVLAGYGYGLPVTGIFDARTTAVVSAFQLHFRQERVDGIADRSTVETLDRLVAALDQVRSAGGGRQVQSR